MSSAGYLSLTDADRDAMLEAIGVDSLEALFEQIPEGSASAGSSTSLLRSPRQSWCGTSRSWLRAMRTRPGS